MRIAFVTQHFYPESFSNNGLARALARRGHEVRVTTAVPNYPGGVFYEGYSNKDRRAETWEGVEIDRVRTVPRGASKLKMVVNYLAFPFFGCLHAAFGRQPKPDVIFASQLSPIIMVLPGLVLSWRTGAPLVHWVQDIWPDSAIHNLGLRNPLIVKPLQWICRWIYRRPDLVLVQSSAFPAKMAELGARPERIRVLPNTAPPAYRSMTPDEAPGEAGLVPQEGFRLMFAGNIGESQDFDTLMAAAELLRDRPELVWVIVGAGRDQVRVEAELARRGLEGRFVFTGRQPEERVPYLLAHADAALVSLKDNPIFTLTVPYKIQCYMACGKPIVASLSGEGARMIGESGAGVMAPAGRPRELAAEIRRLLDMTPEERARMGAAGRAYFDANLAPETVYATLESWLEEVSAARRKGR